MLKLDVKNLSGLAPLISDVTVTPDSAALESSPDTDFSFLAYRNIADIVTTSSGLTVNVPATTLATRDVIAVHATAITPMDLTNLQWQVIANNPESGNFSNPTPANRQGPDFSFVPNPSLEPAFTNTPPTNCNNVTSPSQDAPVGSCFRHKPLSYTIQASINGVTYSVTITQDQKDVIRQEYVSHGLPLVPGRADLQPVPKDPCFPAAGRYSLDNTAYIFVWGDPAKLANDVLSSFNSFIGTPNACSLKISSGWRNPERNEAVGGVQNSDHQLGNALDLQVLGMPVTNQIYATLQAAAYCVVGGIPPLSPVTCTPAGSGGVAICEAGPIPVSCGTFKDKDGIVRTIDHVHVSRRPSSFFEVDQ
jgi:hypothetical protein